jgi:hypothetical protein
MTFEEFVQHADAFARDNHEPGTLTLRQLQRLVAAGTLARFDRQLRSCLQALWALRAPTPQWIRHDRGLDGGRAVVNRDFYSTLPQVPPILLLSWVCRGRGMAGGLVRSRRCPG